MASRTLFRIPSKYRNLEWSDNIYYLESEYHADFHEYIHIHRDELAQIFHYGICQFIDFSQERFDQILTYNFPGVSLHPDNSQDLTALVTRRLFTDIGHPLPRHPLLMHIVYKQGRPYIQCTSLHSPAEIYDLLKRFNDESEILCSIDISGVPSSLDGDADQRFAEEAYKLTQQVKDKIKILQRYGYDKLLKDILDVPPLQPSRMNITDDYRIFLTDYDNIEIKMTPLVKAVYFLFLDYPQGIMFRDLSKPEYMRKLNFIYKALSNRSDYTKIQDSILKISNHRNNSINEKCSRIREAFVSKFTDNLAEAYYITGYRDTPKRIKLDRTLITWQGYPYDPRLWNKRMRYGKDHDEMIAFERREAELNRQVLESLGDLSNIFGTK